MGLTVDDFKRVAQDGGYAQLTSDGKRVSPETFLGSTFLGKVVHWIKSAFRGKDAEKQENVKVMQSFVQALRNKYGEKYNDMLQTDLKPENPTGPLDASVISNELSKLEEIRSSLRQENHAMASACSYGHGMNINLHDLSDGKVTISDFPTSLQTKIQQRIYNTVVNAGVNENKKLTYQEAMSIAKETTKRFYDALPVLRNLKLPESEPQKGILENLTLNVIEARKTDLLENPQFLDGVYGLSRDIIQLMGDLGNMKTLEDRLKAFKAIEPTIAQHCEKVYGKGKWEGYDYQFMIGFAMQLATDEIGAKNMNTLQSMYDSLVSPAGREAYSALYWGAMCLSPYCEDELDDVMFSKMVRMWNIADKLTDEIGLKLGNGEFMLKDADKIKSLKPEGIKSEWRKALGKVNDTFSDRFCSKKV